VSTENLSTKPPKSNYYVDNRLLYTHLCAWLKDLKKANKKKGPVIKPPIPEYVAESMVKMANHFSQKAGFVNYTYREDMVGDALESCIRYIHNFDPTKSNNAFAYITQIIHNAFIRRIQKEQKQLYVKMRIIDDTDFTDSYERQDGDHSHYNNSYVTYLQENKGDVIQKFESWKESKKSKSNKKKETKLVGLFEEEDEAPVVAAEA